MEAAPAMPEPIMLRADITPAEYRAIKALAAHKGLTVQAMVAALLRFGLAREAARHEQ